MSTANYRWLTPLSQQFLERDYLLPGQSLDERVNVIVNRAEVILGIPGFAARFKENLQKGWYSLSTPIWTNFGTERGLPISCFGSYIADNMESILEAHAEVGIMTKQGGGTSGFFGDLRGRGTRIRQNGESSGSVHFMQMFESLINVVSQGSTRRGNFAAYLPIEHPDIEEFLSIRSEGNPIQDLSFGITVTDAFMERMKHRDPEAMRIWARVLEVRSSTGYPYIVFIDTANRNAPEAFKIHSLKITHSNLCSEIMLPDTEEESFVCDLSSMNILHFDEWKDTDAVKLLTYFLDAVMTEFIEKAREIKYLDRAVRFAENHRALGIGWLGWHSYLQSKMVPWESLEAKLLNTKVAKTIQASAQEATRELATLFGEPKYCQGLAIRNSTLLAIAPTKSSAFILGQVSEGIEPHRANLTVKDTAKGKYTVKNQHLEALLDGKGHNTEEVWESIKKRAGSVQHLEFLDDSEKAVFKTFGEISPKEIVIQAAARQNFLDQSQSLNLMIHPDTSTKDINQLMIFAHEMGVKSLYYQFSVNAAQQFSRNILDCVSCSA